MLLSAMSTSGGNQHIAKFTISGMPDKGTGGEIPRIQFFNSRHSGVLRAQSALYMEEKVEQPEEEDVTMKDESKEGNEEAAKKEGEEGRKQRKMKRKKPRRKIKREPKKKEKKFRVQLKVEAVYTGMPKGVIVAQQSREANMYK